jgi:hypothetical protein
MTNATRSATATRNTGRSARTFNREINPRVAAIVIGILVLALLGLGWKFLFAAGPPPSNPAAMRTRIG